MGNAWSLVVAVGVPLVGGAVGGMVSSTEIPTWYANLKKPRWTPPNWAFGPIWSVLYVAQGVASWLVFKRKGLAGAHPLGPLVLYGVQLAFNLAWNPLFFKSHKTDVALADITAVLGFATAATVAMSKATSPKQQLPLMGPYVAFVAYATALNFSIWKDNPSERLLLKGDPASAARKKHDLETTAREASTAAKEAGKAAALGTQAVAAGLSASKAVDSAKAAWASPAEPPPHDPVRELVSGVVDGAKGAMQAAVGAVDTTRTAVTTAKGVSHAVQGAKETLQGVRNSVAGAAETAKETAIKAAAAAKAAVTGPPAPEGSVVGAVAQTLSKQAGSSGALLAPEPAGATSTELSRTSV